MRIKSERLLAIRRLLMTRKIKSQEMLQELLKKQGYNCTQATLSRDLKFLGVARMLDRKGNYFYSIPPNKARVSSDTAIGQLALNGLVSLAFAQGMALLKTRPGYASTIAAVIDSAGLYEIAGTIAGDDTILIIPNDGIDASGIRHSLVLLFPEWKNRIR